MRIENNYIGFFDMLGLQSIAAYDIEKYKQSLDNFHIYSIGAIEKTQTKFADCKIKIYLFSDCAYVESFGLEPLIYFFRILRLSLFTKHIYFQAAITKGKLSCESQDINDDIRTTAFKGIDTVKVYQLQNDFKGIGILVDKSLISSLELNLKQIITTSVFKADENKDEYTPYYDISFEHPSQELGMFSIIRPLVQTYQRMQILNARASRYYISAICSIISNLEAGDIATIKNNDEVKTSSITDFIFNKDQASEESTDYNVFRIIYVNRIYSLFKKKEGSSWNLSICNSIFDQIQLSSYELLTGFKDLDSIPSFILEVQNKEFLADYLSCYD